MFNDKAKWIWSKGTEIKDSYVAFKDEFNYLSNNRVCLKICSETNYVAYVNGKLASYGQFPSYPDSKYFDEIDISALCVKGKNTLNVTVWYEGFDSFTHIDDGAGLIYSVESNSETLAYSSKETLSGIDGNYASGMKKLLTIQLGYSSKMIADGVTEYAKSQEICKSLNISPRPVKKMQEEEFAVAKEISPYIYDLGRETVGYLSIEVECEDDCEVIVSYGEYLKKDGSVPRFLPGGYKAAGRDFSLEFSCKKGVNNFTQYFIRLAGRYLQVEANKPVKLNKIGLIPVMYPLVEKNIKLKGLDKEIYDTCVRTLRLCMHEHYEDCPWREQALYSLDSRNQMLCGYYAFTDTLFQRSNLVFISKGTRDDGFLEITYPAINTPAIPFFSLCYVIAVGEYIKHTGDYSILDQVFDVISVIMQRFIDRIDDKGLISDFPEPFWNFYEWSHGSHNEQELVDGCERPYRHDLILNCAFIYAFKHYDKMLAHYDKKVDVDFNKMKNSINDTFYDMEKGLYYLCDYGEKVYSQLGNSFAILVGLGDESIADKIISDDSLVVATLSMRGFVYDAVLYFDKSRGDYVLNDIRKNYGYMLEQGATSFWETVDGINKSPASSLCHGWSAMPVYYYHKLLGE